MKKRYLWIIIILIIGIVGFLWWRSPSSTLKDKVEELKPTVKVVSVSITDIQEARIKSTLWITITNPLPVGINIPKLDYNVLIDSVKVVESAYNKPIHIESSGNTKIVLPMETLSKPMERLLKRFDEQNRDSAEYTFNVAFSVDVPIAGERDFTVHEKKTLPAIRIPKVKVNKVQIHKLGFKESQLDMDVQIENPSLFTLSMKNAAYTFTIEKVLNLEGTLEKTINVPPRGSQSVPMILEIKRAKVVRLTWKVLFEKKYTDFKMNFSGTIVSPDEKVNNSSLSIAVDGNLGELRDLKKK